MMTRSTYRIEKMDCPTEERMIRAVLDPMAGVEPVEFNLIARTLTVEHEEEREGGIIAAIASLGMEAVPLAANARRLELPVVNASPWRQPATIATALSGLFALTAEILAWTAFDEHALIVRLLAACAILIGGYQTAGKALNALRTFTLNIHFLMALAVAGAVALGEWGEAATVIFLFALAELVEARSLDRARNAIHGLMQLAPSVATVMRGGRPLSVDAFDVMAGETVRIKPGERLPLDGVVSTGRSHVNQAPITGESMPIAKESGDEVFAGSINGSGTFDYAVTHAAGDSTIARIVRLVEKATGNRGRTERFVDRFARYYTPAIFALAVLVATLPPLALGAAWNHWIYNGLVLLVIGCPCALVLSTPVTIVSGLAAAARRGILVKGGAFLERGHQLRAIAFDKTGTLTEARPRVASVVALADRSADELVHLAAAIEARSEHPIAAAIIAEHAIRHVDEAEIVVTAFDALPGRGAGGVVDGQMIYIGNHRLAHELDVCSDAVERTLAELEGAGMTTVVIMTAQTTLGVIAIADTLRSTSADAVRGLHALGIGTAMLTGDSARTASGVAATLGIDHVFADLLPEEKMEALAGLEKRYGGEVGMVGEGVNDVPALSRASIGFVMGAAGADVALETADVALMDDDLRKVPEFIRLSRRSLRVLKQNITIALALKLIFFGLALAGKATLWMAVFADMGASLIVVANGLRMLRVRPPRQSA